MGVFPNTPEIRALIRSALQEDSAKNDLTTKLIIERHWTVRATLVAGQAGVVCGLPLAQKIFKTFDHNVRFRAQVREGARVRPGQVLAEIRGPARSILSAERPALNAVQHLSGIATLTRECCDKLRGTRTRLYDTRKTLPGWRVLQKYAVRCGGGRNHRMSLGTEILIKENHLKIAREHDTRWSKVLQTRWRGRSTLPIEMEVQTRKDLVEVIRLKPQCVLLDNFSPRDLKPMIRQLRRQIPGVQIELSGGIRPDMLRRMGRLGADRISMGCLTHSVQAFNCSLDITHDRA